MAEDGGATSLRGSHIVKEGKARANNKKTRGGKLLLKIAESCSK
jgi:hypothetical protein